jgi:hypothetical protein
MHEFYNGKGFNSYYEVISFKQFKQMMFDYDNNIPTESGYFVVLPVNKEDKYTAIDNTSFDMWAEEFNCVTDCVEWFCGEDLDSISFNNEDTPTLDTTITELRKLDLKNGFWHRFDKNVVHVYTADLSPNQLKSLIINCLDQSKLLPITTHIMCGVPKL